MMIQTITTKFPTEQQKKDYYYVSLYYGLLMKMCFGPESITPCCRTAIDQIGYYFDKLGSLMFGNEEPIEQMNI